MHLLENTFNLLQNGTASILAFPTPFAALDELPPPVVEDFWKLTGAAIKVVERARDNELLADRSEKENLDKLSNVLTRALRLNRLALHRAAVSEQELKRVLDQWQPEPRLETVLLRRYFYEIRGLMARIVEYGQTILDAYDQHPVFIMDVNRLLDAVERFSGYVRPSESGGPEPAELDVMYLLRAIAGEVTTWYDSANPYSEFSMLRSASGSPDKLKDQGRSCADTQKYLTMVWSGATAEETAELRAWQEQAWFDARLNPTTKLPHNFKTYSEIYNDAETREIWFYINGVVTDHWIAQLNAESLAEVFKRPIHILHNPTYGLHRDIAECVKGRILEEKTDVATELRSRLERLAEAKDSAKVVLVAHSQGTIIASEILRELRNLKSGLPRRMEVYNFAFCADQFPESCCREVEHFVNENDFVASLSLVPENAYEVPGRVYRRCGKWGHFLGAHYLDAFHKGAYKDDNGAFRSSRLFNYIGGKNYGR